MGPAFSQVRLHRCLFTLLLAEVLCFCLCSCFFCIFINNCALVLIKYKVRVLKPDYRAAVMALQAGADLLLMPADFKEAYNGVLDAVKTGELTEERIDQSLTRILGLKLTLPRHKR